MSSGGQILGGVVGAVAGFFVSGGNPMGALYGAQIGMGVGSYIDPPKGPKGPHLEGPRLNDLTVQTSTYGAAIPRVYGTMALHGNVFWLENNALKEVVTTSTSSSGGGGGGGKGGGGGGGGGGGASTTTTTTYSYYATFAVGLADCRGVPLVGVRRIWVGARLIYDAGSIDFSAIAASNSASTLFTFYPGSDTQLPDERMQATLGVANTPAYRGLAYLVFKDYPLKDHGNSLQGAQVKVEIVSAGSVSEYIPTVRDLPAYRDWYAVAWNGVNFVALARSSAFCATSPDGITWTEWALPLSKPWQAVAWNGSVFCAVTYGTSSGITSPDGRSWAAMTLPGANQWADIAWNGSVFCTVSTGDMCATSPNGTTWTAGTMPASAYWNSLCWNGSVFLAITSNATAAISRDGLAWTAVTLPASSVWSDVAWNGSVFCVVATDASVAVSADGITWALHSIPIVGEWQYIAWDGSLFYALTSSGSKSATSPDGIVWTQRSTPAVSPGVSSLTFGGAVFCTVANGTKAMTVQPHSLAGENVLLSDIVHSELLASNLLESGDIDTSELTQLVRGYRVASVAAIRSAIEPLQGAWPFDVVQSGYQICFRPRGSSNVANIPAADLDARGAGDTPGVSMTNVREMDTQLPAKVSLKYIDVSREYDIGEQYAERLNTDAVNITSLDLALSMTGGEAAATAEMLLYLYWLERYELSFRLPPTYNHLEPADVVTINADEAAYSLRLTAITYTQDGRLECAARYHSAAIYTPAALGEEGQSTGAVMTTAGATRYQLLDIPLLLDATDTAGFPAAMSGYQPGWSGGVIYRTDDSGQTWTWLQPFSAPGATIGYAAAAIGSGRTDLIDKASTLLVYLTSGELASVTEAALLGGANHFAYGIDGRWEIVGAQNCTLQADGSYVLTDLLRGRAGSEWACGLHAAGDTIILLDAAHLAFITTSLNSIGLARTYRGVTAGQSLQTAADNAFTYTGVNLECLAPVYLNGNRHPSTGDWTLTWLRRTRTGGAWRDYVDATLGEASESYEIDIFSDASYSTLKRTLAAATPTVAYTSAQQVTDFGSNQATLYVKVYQLSANVGRGYPLTTSITR